MLRYDSITLFIWNLLDMSKTGSLVILGVLLIRYLLRNAPKKYSYMLWSLVAFRFICPISFSSVLSIFNITKLLNVKVGSTLGNIVDSIQPQYIVNTYENLDKSLISGNVDVFHPMKNIIPSLWFNIWIVIVSILIIFTIVSYFEVKDLVKTSIRFKENIFQSENITSPFVFGYLKPRIYIPYHLDEQTQQLLIQHEQVHIQRKDYLFRLFAYILCMIYWFNPLVWLSYHLFIQDMEMSCDEQVLSNINESNKIYSTTLLSFASHQQFSKPKPCAFSETSIKSRIMNVLKWKKPSKKVVQVSLILCSIALFAFSSNPSYQNFEDLIDNKINDSKQITITHIHTETNEIKLNTILNNDLIIEPFENIFNEIKITKLPLNKTKIENIGLVIEILDQNNEITIYKFSNDYKSFIIEKENKVIEGYKIMNPVITKSLIDCNYYLMNRYEYNCENDADLMDVQLLVYGQHQRMSDQYQHDNYANFWIQRRNGKNLQIIGHYTIENNQLILIDRDDLKQYVFDLKHDEFGYYITFNPSSSAPLPELYNIVNASVVMKDFRYLK